MTYQMREDDPFEDFCPSCGQYLGGEGICPNCGTEIFNEDGLDDIDGDEDEEADDDNNNF